MMKQFYVLLCLLGLCISTSLAQKSHRITMFYQETVCPPAWHNYYHPDSTLINLKQMLGKDSVEVFKIRYTGRLFEMTCEGCQCLTGRNIEITIGYEDRKRAEMQGFKFMINMTE